MKFSGLTFILTFFSISIYAQKPPRATVNEGTLEGITLPSGISAFRGVPFAVPPVGNLRWKAPQPPAKWKGVRKADTFSAKPMQMPVFSDMNFRASGTSEDCLYLNIWAPQGKKGVKLPVLVYFYGGGFVAGDGSEYRYDGESLAKTGIVTVTVNYRLGVFGFLTHPGLTKESPNHASGNYGLLDQREALVWVKKNIAAFGGDPDKVTIAGESAGSISVSAHMASPLSKGLFHGAIGQSGAMINPTLPPVTLSQAEKQGEAFMQKIGAKSIDELRSLPAEKLMDMPYQPGSFEPEAVIDGYFLTKDPVAVFTAGEQAKVPLLAGWTSTESSYGGFLEGKFPSPENYTAKVKEVFKERADEVLRLYPGTTQAEVIASATALASDKFIVYSTWKWIDLHRKNSGVPVYAYIFAQPRPKSPEVKPGDLPEPLEGSGHSHDIEYMLGNLSTNKVYNWTAEDYKVSELAVDYLANFIKTGNPNGKDVPSWMPCTFTGKLNIQTIDASPSGAEEQHRSRYLFLDMFYSQRK